MTANELRIGNLVLCNPLDMPQFIATIEEIGEKKARIKECKQDPIIGYLEYDFISPIPLTEDWLLKFGFIMYGLTKEENEVYRKNWDEGFFELEKVTSFYYGGNYTSVKLDYVHQLQNLYFALTGQELKVKE